MGMLGLVYLILCFGVGFVICNLVFPKFSELTKTTYSGREIRIPSFFVSFPAWMLVGTVPMVWATYLLGYLFRNSPNPFSDSTRPVPLFYANLIIMPIAAVFVALGILYLLKKSRKSFANPFGFLRMGELIFVFASVGLVFTLMWWTLFVRDGNLYVGVSVFSDFAPHLGMIRSFSYGTNFPTSYSHFGGEDIKYHFLFQFLVGNLEFLGMRIDFAFNLPSCIFLAGVFFLLYAYAVKLTGRRSVGYLAGLFFAFRSSRALFDYLANLDTETTSISQALEENYTFIGTTQHEDWGLWNLNVYCNQRHFALGICALLFLVFMLTDCVFRATARVKRTVLAAEQAFIAEQLSERETGLSEAPSDDEPFVPENLIWSEKMLLALKASLFTKEGWLPRSIAAPVALGLLLGLCSFFNGACVIGCLAVLFVMAFVADHRLEYAIVAAITVALAELEAHFFINGSAVSPTYYFGFLADNRTFFGLAAYILALCGILPLILICASVIINNTHKWVLFSFLAPFILACTLSLTTDVTVNHKYIMLSVMLLGIYAAMFVSWLFHRFGLWPKIIAVFIVICMTATGLYDFTLVLKKNDSSNSGCLTYALDDEVTMWFKENATSQDLVLSNYYSLNRVVLGGAMLYYGWPYFAWSAGYDTDSRDAKTKAMFAADTPEELRTMIEENNIRFIYVDDDLRNSDYFELHEETIIHTYECVFTSGDVSIYDTEVPVSEESPYYDPDFDYTGWQAEMWTDEETEPFTEDGTVITEAYSETSELSY